jgi:hypothetical protein
MASRWQRWNSTTHIFEYSTDDGGSWAPLALNASILNEGTVALARISGLTNAQIDAAAAIARSKLDFGSGLVNADIAAAAAIAWTKLDKTGSSLADFTTRSAAALTSGNLDVARLPTGGTWTLSSDLVLSANILQINGGQIKFPATQVPSSDANTLDDYEEGTWTPTASVALGLAIGRYFKIGKIVFANYVINITGTASANAATLGGLPFACNNIGYFGPGYNAYETSGARYYPMAVDGSSNVNLYDAFGTLPSFGTISGGVAISMYGRVIYEANN